jgi:hypothetical protein
LGRELFNQTALQMGERDRAVLVLHDDPVGGHRHGLRQLEFEIMLLGLRRAPLYANEF